jgi:hypothetical protein
MKQPLGRNVIAGLMGTLLVLIANAVLSDRAADTLVRNEKLAVHMREVSIQ